MSFFSNLFGSSSDDNPPGNITVEQFLASADVKNILLKHQRRAVLLKPRKSSIPVDIANSKFGGKANMIGFESWPKCPACHTPLNFVLQLYKRDIPSFYFAPGSDLFQLFRCPNHNCSDTNNDQYDQPTFHYFFSANGAVKEFENPGHLLKESESTVPDCTVHPEAIDDYPNFDDYPDGETDFIQQKYGDEMDDVFCDTYSANHQTKCGGYPSFTQSPYYPVCKCGELKQFFFQLASDDSHEKPGGPDFNWSPHGIMIGDVGNIYFYVCPNCGSQTIESYWDCC